ncbi:PTS sugar transporter subunit IIA [bacterium]|nr:PTS sugar transporter subunit IIA [bacterium]
MIKELLTKERIIIPLTGKTKEEILREFVDHAKELKLIDDSEQVYNRILELENIGSSALEKGIALPHIRDNIIRNIFVLIGISKSGVDFDSIDGELSTIIFFIGAQRNDKKYLPLLSKISQMCSYGETRESLLNAHNVDEVMGVISNWET